MKLFKGNSLAYMVSEQMLITLTSLSFLLAPPKAFFLAILMITVVIDAMTCLLRKSSFHAMLHLMKDAFRMRLLLNQKNLTTTS